MKNKRNLIIIAAVVVVVIIALVAAKKSGKIGQAPGTDVSVDSVMVRTITETITANGKVQPETEVKISADVSGEIVELHVIEGQDVKEGQLLLKIKPDIYISALERVEAALNSSHSNLANAKARLAQVKAQFVQTDLSYKRNKQLYDQGAISKAEFENISAQFEVSKAEVEAANQSVKAAEYQVKSSEATLKEARENLQKTTIYAPVSGTVSRLNVEKGERVVGTIQMTGTEIMRIANLNLMEVKVDVNENDIINVNINDTALIEVDAYLGQKFKGLVREVANSANTTGLSADQVTNFEVKIRILPDSYKHLVPANNPNYYPFRPGMSGTVDIQTDTRLNVLTVPIQAVTTRPDSTNKSKTVQKETKRADGFENADEMDEEDNKTKKSDVKMQEVVFLYVDGKAKICYVKTGIQDNSYIEIISGVKKGDEVISAPYSAISKKLNDGMKVEKKDKDKLFQKK